MKESPAAPLRVALFGAGGFAADHVRMIEELQAEGRVRFLAVADPTVDKLADLKNRLEQTGVIWFLDFQELLDKLDGHLDLVVISTPIPLHCPMLEASLEKGLFVFLEKPPVPLIQDFLRLSAHPNIHRVAVGFKLMADPAIWALKKALVAGQLGSIRRIAGSACWPRLDSYYSRASWAGRLLWHGMPVMDGPATNALAHILHNMIFLGGQSVEEFAVPTEVRGELYRVRRIESYDTCCLSGRWSSGTEFSAAFSHAVEVREEWEIIVEGDLGRARLTKEGLFFDSDTIAQGGTGFTGSPFRDCWLNFCALAAGEISKPLTSFQDCRGYVAATNAMFSSSGAIHSVPPAAVQRYERGDDGGFMTAGIQEAVAGVLRGGKLFSDQQVSWAVPGRLINVDGMETLLLDRFLTI